MLFKLWFRYFVALSWFFLLLSTAKAQVQFGHPRPEALQAKWPKFDVYLKENLKFNVPTTTVPQILEELKQGRSLILLDARSLEQYEAGHIPKARRVGFDDFGPEKVWMLDREAEIIVYCTVSRKSEAVAAYLQDMGFKRVRNLYGSVIEWVNYRQPLINSKGEPSQILLLGEDYRLKRSFVRNPSIKTRP